MSSNSNLGYTGYLLRKTVQPHSLRKENTNFNDFREKNMLLYINKKVSHTREREGSNLSNQTLQKGIHLIVRKGAGSNGQGSKANNDNDDDNRMHTQNEEVNLAQLIKQEEQERQNPFYQEAVQKMQENEFQDDFAIVSEENKIGKNAKSKKHRSDIEQTLNILIANKIEQPRIKELFRDYKKISLKDKLNNLKSRHLDMAKIQSKIKKDSSQAKDFKDTEKVYRFMNQICNAKGITIGKILQINEKDIEYTEPTLDGVPKAKALEMFEEFMEDQEEENQKNMIKIFKQSQLDNIDADAARNKFNMTSFKKKNEQTEKLYNQMARNNKNALLNAMKDPQTDPQKFARIRDKVKPPSEKVNVFRRLTAGTNSDISIGKQEKSKKVSCFTIDPQSLLTQQDIYHRNLENEFSKLSQTYSTGTSFKKPQSANHTKRKSIDSGFFQSKAVDPYRQFQSTSSLIQSSDYQQQQYTPITKSRVLKSAFTQNQSQSPNHPTNFSTFSTDFKNSQIKSDSSPTLHTNFAKTFSQSIQVRGNSNPSQSSFRYSQPEIHPVRNQSFQSKEEEAILQEEQDKLKQKIMRLREKNMDGQAKQLERILDKIETSKQVADFVNQCNRAKSESNFATKKTKSKINQLEKIIDDQLREVQEQQQGEANIEAKIENLNFIEFIKRADFKRNLIKFLISKVNNKSDIYSIFKSKQFTSNFFLKLTEKESLVPLIE